MQKVVFLKYDDFSDASLLQLNGSAASQSRQLVLTSDTAWLKGSAFYMNSIPLPSRMSFSTFFTFNIIRSAFDHGDGMTLTIQGQSQTALGALGGALGYSGIRPSIAVEFDTARNAGYNDINDNHAGIDVDGSLVSITSYNLTTAGFTLANGSLYYAWIDYNNPILEVRINNSTVRPSSAILTANIDLTSSMLPCNIFAGFTAGTGSFSEKHSIISWYFSNQYDPIDVNNNTYIEAPKLIEVSIKSSNAASGLAYPGDTVFLDFTAKAEISNISVTINNQSGTVASTGGNSYRGSYMMTRNDIEDTVTFAINFSDNQGNSGTTVVCTTDESEVRFINATRGVNWFF
ncbi:MAG: hypothetical protein ABFC84_03450 [Veillonellales bacterium]